jgi:ATP-dependent helicase HrpB
VGYQVRFDNKAGPRTKLRVVTEAILTNALLDDPSLDGIGCVVLDEFHERSIYSDLAIALLRDVRASLRDDLHVVVMSATLDAEPIAEFLGGAPIVRVPGRTFPVSISHKPRGGGYLEDAVADAVAEAPDDGHALVFLPGAAEIQAAQAAIAGRLPGRLVLPLYGSLPFDEQRRAVAPSRDLKIVLATNIAETSLTIDGVRTVIDSGLSRQTAFDAGRGLDTLRLGKISLASATQRAGRAGRTAEGRCVRLWSAQEERQMPAFDPPEIARVDLAPTLLELHAWGEVDPSKFGFFQPPPAESIAAAERLLAMLGALDAGHKLTPLGKRLRGLPVHPRLGRLLLEAAARGQPRLGSTVAAILSERISSTAAGNLGSTSPATGRTPAATSSSASTPCAARRAGWTWIARSCNRCDGWRSSYAASSDDVHLRPLPPRGEGPGAPSDRMTSATRTPSSASSCCSRTPTASAAGAAGRGGDDGRRGRGAAERRVGRRGRRILRRR